MIIYKVTNKINDKIYIGQTIRKLYQRKAGHKCSAIKKKNISYFHNALRKYNIDNFEWEVIEECNSKEDLDLAEEWYIMYYKSHTTKWL